MGLDGLGVVVADEALVALGLIVIGDHGRGQPVAVQLHSRGCSRRGLQCAKETRARDGGKGGRCPAAQDKVQQGKVIEQKAGRRLRAVALGRAVVRSHGMGQLVGVQLHSKGHGRGKIT